MQQHVPENRVYEGFQPEIVQQILEEQKQKWERFASGENEEDEIPYVCLVFEDTISDKHLKYEELLWQLVFAGR